MANTYDCSALRLLEARPRLVHLLQVLLGVEAAVGAHQAVEVHVVGPLCCVGFQHDLHLGEGLEEVAVEYTLINMVLFNLLQRAEDEHAVQKAQERLEHERNRREKRVDFEEPVDVGYQFQVREPAHVVGFHEAGEELDVLVEDQQFLMQRYYVIILKILSRSKCIRQFNNVQRSVHCQLCQMSLNFHIFLIYLGFIYQK
ncbi:Hypothetical_protein [Hexamita inflata]|uniref:Hypothetical_protein n=1 Tax=Hexamita inflata TaxID=28002 RepID=A0ABP1GWR3_9EUKA